MLWITSIISGSVDSNQNIDCALIISANEFHFVYDVRIHKYWRKLTFELINSFQSTFVAFTDGKIDYSIVRHIFVCV